MAQFFEHVLHLPLSFHGAAHSGRLLKIMLEGANGMAGLWLSFFRENCASLRHALLILLPLSLTLNWRLAAVLIALVFVFGALTTFVLRRTESLQQTVEGFNSSLAERASDALGNLPVIQSFTRIESRSARSAQITSGACSTRRSRSSPGGPSPRWRRAPRRRSRLCRSSCSAPALHLHGPRQVGEIVTFTNFATMLIAPPRAGRQLLELRLFLQAPKLADFFDVLDTDARRCADRPVRASTPGRSRARVGFEDVSLLL